MTGWRRPSAHGREEIEDVLYKGIPPWLVQGLVDWLQERYSHESTQRGRVWRTQDLKRLELKLRRVSFVWDYDSKPARILRSLMESTDVAHQEIALDAIHLTLQEELGRESSVSVDELENVLAAGASEWRAIVRDGRAGLEYRVTAEVAGAAEKAMAAGDVAAKWLREAWGAAYGRDPSPNAAYGDAIKAVEAAAQPVVEPNNPAATLGTMIAVLRNKPTDWVLAIQPKDGDPDPVTTLIETMRLLWRGHRVRHGSGDAAAAIQLDQQEAEAALHLAIALVQWFRSGGVARRT